MKSKPSPPELVRAFEASVASLRGAERRKMFGYPAVFVNGNMFAGLVRDSMILRVARDWFGLGDVGGLEFLCAEAEVAVQSLAAAGRRFDFIMEDAAYADTPERALPLARALTGRVAAGGTLVLNRHFRADARELTREMRARFEQVSVRRVRREGENALVICVGPRELTGC